MKKIPLIVISIMITMASCTATRNNIKQQTDLTKNNDTPPVGTIMAVGDLKNKTSEKLYVAENTKNVSNKLNLIINGAALPAASESELTKIKNITTEFNSKNLVCGFLQAYGSSYNVTVTATENRCFTWVFSKNGRVTSMQSIQAESGQSYNAYSSDGVTTVGISCDCYF
jgi:hypothetical protein